MATLKNVSHKLKRTISKKAAREEMVCALLLMANKKEVINL